MNIIQNMLVGSEVKIKNPRYHHEIIYTGKVLGYSPATKLARVQIGSYTRLYKLTKLKRIKK